MDVSEYKSMAIRSAQLYYDYLAENGLGVSTTLVSKITPGGDMFLLDLKTRLSRFSMEHLDSLQFQFHGRRYTSYEIAPVDYDAHEITLLVRPLPELSLNFSALSSDDLVVVSDLKFLVKRTADWYFDHGDLICFPPVPSNATEISYPPNAEVSPNQRAAVAGALSSPLSYVWGAPGTGKTRVVLSSCILSLLRSNQRVLLLAPTNNALEQVLYGVLPILQDAGISLNRVIRLGVPSAEFEKKYPSVCERPSPHMNMDKISSELEHLQKYWAYVSFKEQFELADDRAATLLDEMDEIVSVLLPLDKELADLKRSLSDTQTEERLLRQEDKRLSSQIIMQERDLGRYGPIRRLLFARQYEAEKSALQALQAAFSDNSFRILHAIRERKDLSKQIELIAQQQNSLSERFAALHEELKSLTAFWPFLQHPTKYVSSSNWHVSYDRIIRTFEAGRKNLSEKSAIYVDCIARSPEANQEKYDYLLDLKKKAEISPDSTASWRTGLDLVASTVDNFLALTFAPGGFYPSHIFLDEAAYCSLIKAASALSLHVPVTLLGDHMQLPPVCEMSDEIICSEDHDSVCLWCQSAAHLERIFSDSPQQILDSYLSGEAAPFERIDRFDLDCTFRFGSSLADILADMVYTPAFHSGSPGGTELLVLDAPKTPGAPLRTSPAEVTAIKNYLSQFPLNDFAIITPYRKQAELLSSAFPSKSKDERILTVHASQGREWDTVFFSVVDSTNKWFTDSCNSRSKGKMVINTAISRVKKRLILVCDYNYWVTQDNQLLGQIIRSATEVKSGELPSPPIKK